MLQLDGAFLVWTRNNAQTVIPFSAIQMVQLYSSYRAMLAIRERGQDGLVWFGSDPDEIHVLEQLLLQLDPREFVSHYMCDRQQIACVRISDIVRLTSAPDHLALTLTNADRRVHLQTTLPDFMESLRAIQQLQD